MHRDIEHFRLPYCFPNIYVKILTHIYRNWFGFGMGLGLNCDLFVFALLFFLLDTRLCGHMTNAGSSFHFNCTTIRQHWHLNPIKMVRDVEYNEFHKSKVRQGYFHFDFSSSFFLFTSFSRPYAI